MGSKNALPRKGKPKKLTNMSTAAYYRVFIELRFPIYVDLYSLTSQFIKLFWEKEKIFENYQIESSNSLKFYNGTSIRKSFEFFHLQDRRFVYSLENPENKNQFMDRFDQIYTLLNKKIEFKKFHRIGVRTQSAIESLPFDNCIEKANQGEIYSLEFLKSLDLKISDFATVINTEDTRFEFGPMLKTQNHPYLDYFTNQEKIPESFTFLDIDVSKKSVEARASKLAIQEIYNKNIERMNKFISYGKV